MIIIRKIIKEKVTLLTVTYRSLAAHRLIIKKKMPKLQT